MQWPWTELGWWSSTLFEPSNATGVNGDQSDNSVSGAGAVYLFDSILSLALTAHEPITNAVGVDVTADITAAFSADVNGTTVTSRTLAVHAGFGGLMTGTLTVAGDGLTLDPSRDLFAGEQVQVIATDGIEGTAGTALTPTQWGFTAGPLKDRCVIFAEDTSASAVLAGVWAGSVAWGDYDNDGDLDILLTGNPSGTPIAKVYENTGGTFVEDTSASAVLTGVWAAGSMAWGDYDNDGDLDITLSGWDSDQNAITKVYENSGGAFAEDTSASAVLAGVWAGSVAWGDYDNDGDLDILLTGYTTPPSPRYMRIREGPLPRTRPQAASLAGCIIVRWHGVTTTTTAISTSSSLATIAAGPPVPRCMRTRAGPSPKTRPPAPSSAGWH